MTEGRQVTQKTYGPSQDIPLALKLWTSWHNVLFSGSVAAWCHLPLNSQVELWYKYHASWQDGDPDVPILTASALIPVE